MASIRKRGNFQFQARIYRGGFPAQTKTFNSKAEAEAWSRAIESEMDRGIFVSRIESEKTTLSEALERYSNIATRPEYVYFFPARVCTNVGQTVFAPRCSSTSFSKLPGRMISMVFPVLPCGIRSKRISHPS